MTKKKLTIAALASCFYATTLLASTTFVPNSIKYKDSSLPNGKGQSGSAVVEARALLGADLMTDLELNTNGTGSLEKLQIKRDGAVINENSLSGTTYVHRLGGLTRHQQLDLHVNVKSGETTVVQVAETVKLRPSLTANDYSGPASVVVGAPANITAVIRELNGDVGARASCVLTANGQEVDRASNIWVDAGGTVSCRFAHAFTEPGTYDMRVHVTDVNPGDFLPNDNTTGGTLVVQSPTQAFDTWEWSVKDWTHTARYVIESYELTAESNGGGWNQSSDFNATIANRSVNIYDVAASVSEYNDGALLSESSFTAFDRSPICAYSFDGSAARMIAICNIDWMGPTFVSLTVSRTSGDITYFAHGWERNYNPATGGYDVYAYNVHTDYSYGLQQRFGDTASLRVTLTAGSTTWEANPSMTLEPFTFTNDIPRYCDPDHPGFRDFCWEQQYSEQGKRGTVSSQ